MFRCLFILNSKHLKLFLHFVFQICKEFFTDIANCGFSKINERFFFASGIELLQFVFLHRHLFLKSLIELALKALIGLLIGLVALVLANVRPRTLD